MSDDAVFWADQLADDIVAERGDQDRYVFNSGMSVSGRMHIGNLRGELMIPSRVRTILEDRGASVAFRGVYYTQDRFKGTDEQLAQFDDPADAERYVGWRLIDVPDPQGCHENWVAHFNAANTPYLPEFGIDVDPLTTTAFYRMDATRDLITRFLAERDRVREVVNRFRERNPYPDDWIPFDPLCAECSRIDTTTATDVDLDDWRVRYRCSDCGAEGWSDMTDGKLAWRLEWAALWHVLDVDFEPYGKDHATPGGSRDSCVALAEAFDLNYPAGFAFNWVYLKDGDDVREMTSSGDIGITAEEYLAVAEPEVLAYLYLSTRPMAEMYFSPADIPTYTRRFDRAERVYFGTEELDDEKREMNLERVYELVVQDPPAEQPVRVPFDHAAFVAQTVPKGKWRGDGIAALRATGHVPASLSTEQEDRIIDRLDRARAWAAEYAPDDHVYAFNRDVPDDEWEALSAAQQAAVVELRDLLAEEDFDTSAELEDALFDVARSGEASVGEFFTAAYRCLLSRDDGPRLAEFILTRGQDEIVAVLDTVD